MWFFEMADLMHKLVITSLIAFVPFEQQMSVAMAFVTLYTILILVGRPYLRKSDDRLHLFAQVEIFLMLNAGNAFNSLTEPDPFMETVMSVFLVVLLAVFIGFFLLQAFQAVAKIFKRARKHKKAIKEKLQGKEVAEKEAKFRELTLKELHPEFRISRAQFHTKSRQIVGDTKLADLEIVRNPMWGTEGASALFDPTDSNDIIEDIKMNPMHEATKEVGGETAVIEAQYELSPAEFDAAEKLPGPRRMDD